MQLLWVHRLLIGCAIVLAAGFGARELALVGDGTGEGSPALAIVSFGVAIALGWYLLRIVKKIDPRGRSG